MDELLKKYLEDLSITADVAEDDVFDMYWAIYERARELGIQCSDRMGFLMDVQSADLRFHLRLREWLSADDFQFAHDYYGIYENIRRDAFPATEFGNFVPRFAGRRRREEEEV